MSEQRRVPLTPFGKSEKKSNKSPRKTFRFSFTLSDPKEDSCPVFDYGSVVKSEERKIVKKFREDKDKKSNGVLDPLNEDDDEDVKKLVQKFEAKYGNNKKCRSKSYAELGAGYDETDPFIDNTEACDEALQEDQETPYGGYYINSGPLELKRVEVSDQSDMDEVGKRKHKRGLPVIEEEEDDEEEHEEEEGEVDTEPKLIQSEVLPEVKKAKITTEREEPEEKPAIKTNHEEEPVKKKKKRLLVEDTVPPIKIKKAKTVKALLEEKRVQEPPIIEEPKKQVASITSISEAIESVVNAGNHDENSNSSSSSQSAGTMATSSASDDSQDAKPSMQIVPPPLPDNLSAEVLTLVDQIKRSATVTDNTRKTFCTEINNGLIKLEWKSKELSAAQRHLLFTHLACYLPCTKDTLMRRAKKMFLHKEESQIDTLICKLKATIDATMPTLQENYFKECQRAAEEKGIASSPSNGTAAAGDNLESPDSAGGKLPKRKFPWTEETKGYLREIVRLKNRCYKVLKPRKSTNEEYVATFIHTKIRPLWPQGWMRNSVLLRESSRMPHSGKSKHSSNHTPSKNDSSKLNLSSSYLSPSPTKSDASKLNVSSSYLTPTPAGSIYASLSADTPQQPTRSPTHAASDHLNLLTKITSSISPSHSKKSPGQHHNAKTERPEMFSMDSLLKRTNENTNCHDYNTTLSDLIKKEGVIINGASLPLKNVNSSPMNDSGRNENVLDLSSFNSSVCGSPSVIQSVSTNERTTMRASDSVSLSATKPDKKNHTKSPSPVIKESAAVDGKKPAKDVERRMSEETTTATDILSRIISESLLSPPLPPSTSASASLYTTKVAEEKKVTSPSKGQELLFDVMQDLKELNHMSTGKSLDAKLDSKVNKNNSYSGSSWPQSNKLSEDLTKSSQFHNEFLKHIYNSQDTSLSASQAPSPYARHTVSPYENSQYMNDISKSVYNSTPHRPSQGLSSHAGSPASKVSQMNPGCIMKPLPGTGISSGQPHRYMTQMDYTNDDQHLLGLASSLQYGLGWPYTGSESQSHQ